MDPSPSPSESAEPDLVIEPVVGWRLWRLAPDADGELTLASPMLDHPWPPMEPTRAECRSSNGSHSAPSPVCMCGLYATSRLERLPGAASPLSGRGCAVVGSVSLWGTVVEHAAGYRAGLGYPDRIRLVCGPCFGDGRDGVPTRVFLTAGGQLIPACSVHTPAHDAKRSTISPTALEQELLSRYAVDLLPLETLHASGFLAGPPPASGSFAAEARSELRQLVRSRAGWLGATVLVLAFFALRALGVLASPDVPESLPAPTAVTVASPLPGTGDPVRPPLEDPSQDADGGPSVFPFFAFVCGRLMGDSVELVDCARRNVDLPGTGWSPPAPRKDCEFGNAYTRKEGFSVCWLDPTRPVDGSEPRLAILQLPGVHHKDIG